ncbi:MAG: 4Fe-4S dicluster domain-containing protein [Deltaproteobacteria bacterium]|nr:4Fe-4S dicluster domain-containing protein [Deltaproteobacteria bacterium]
MTHTPGIFAAGEAVTGPSSIIHAIAEGRRAAVALDTFLGGKGAIDRAEAGDTGLEVCEPSQRGTPRHRAGAVAPGERVACFVPVETGYSEETAVDEALRCLACDARQFTVEVNPDLCKECGYCQEVCSLNVFTPSDTFNPGGYRPVTAKDTDRCVGCLKCLAICPDFALSLRNGDTDKH